jgi:lysozyme family protein
MDKQLKQDYSPRFLAMVSQVIAHETGGDRSGGYTNDPDDPGGETKWGISKRSYPSLNIKALTFNDAIAIYYKDFYTGIDTILDNALAFKLFDMSVLNGRAKAIKLFQRAIRDVGATIKTDGYLGPITVAAANSVDPKALYVKYQELINNRFKWIATLRPSSKKYLKGWKSRLFFNFDIEDIA